MIPTPDVSHLTSLPYLNHVYEPAEDTFALLDALEQDADKLQNQNPRLVVEIGCGSGCVSAFMANILKSQTTEKGTSAAFLCTDINPIALDATSETAKRNDLGHSLSVIRMNALDGLMQRCKGKIDVLLFNPPYVPTFEEEEQMAQMKASIEGSWAGGSLGRRLLDELLPQLPHLLSPNGGRFYFVAIKQNQPEELVEQLSSYGLTADICLSRRAGREHLFIIRAIRAEL
ncbi:S-adenosyl-L-methionine-dependent methyltransferase [Meira miltonrushii]|uniref:S-adenosyl-L-methionine-dependent methyltransferase n=1 Tax=Meira miltonrushii TaxID=1280837 RepID=A0A316V6I5_9BASI|nr:S-adenosyl-L-methionine-dependent methyltransferase [Meira miltonrushii]PWN32864.1 S-adenosyl-L-methionine-dependent methyltransferase [Meira miltonrushii]